MSQYTNKNIVLFFFRFLPINYMMSQTTQLLDITSQVQQESEASKNEGTYIIHT